MKSIGWFIIVWLTILLRIGPMTADEAPISGTVKSADTMAKTITIETTSKGKTRQVSIEIKLATKIVRFVRSSEPGKGGFVEQDVPLTDLKAGWVVSVTATHEGGREVADVVKVILEK